MHRRALALSGLAIAAALSLGGCNSVFGETASPNFQAFLKDLQTCDRHYQGAMGTGGAGFSAPSANLAVNIDCKANAPVAVFGAAPPTQ